MVHGNWGHNDTAALVLHGRQASNDVVNVFHLECDSVQQALNTSDAASQAAFDSVLDDWRTNVMSLWLACINSTYTLPRISVQVVERLGQFEHRLSPTERTYSTSIAGTAGGGSHAITTAGIIRWKTPVAGKSHRGRTYVPEPTESQQANGVLGATAQAAYSAFADAMLARYAAGGGGTFPHFSLTIYSRPYTLSHLVRRVAGVPTVFPIGPYDGNSTNCTAKTVDTSLRVQRRRELGVGS